MSGASAGGRDVLHEALKNSLPYAGLILMCPASFFPPGGLVGIDGLDMPIWLLSGEKDGLIAPFCRRLAAELECWGKRCHFVQVPEGGHSAPLLKIDWARALDYVSVAEG